MSDQEISPNDEYKITDTTANAGEMLPEEQYNADSEHKENLTPRNFWEKINWRRFIIPTSVLGAILVIYFVLGFFSSHANKEAEHDEAAMQNQAAFVQKSQVPAAANIPASRVTPVADLPQTNVNDDKVRHMQNTLQEKIDDVMHQIAGSQERFTSLSNTVAQTQQDINVFGQKLEQLADVMQQVLVEVEKLKKPIKPVKKKVVKPPVAYHVRAIVPGRVWLESADGRNVTLRIGDQLDGYGEVLAIDSRQGMVVVSNGSIIQYGVNDF